MNVVVQRIVACFLLCIILAACNSEEEKHQKYMRRGNQLFETGDYSRARLEYKNAARIKPADPDVRYRIGLLDESGGDLQGAFGNFMAAEQQDAHFRPALAKLAHYYLAAEQYDESQKRINTILQDKPNDPDGHALMAALHLRHKEYDATEKEARVALSQDSANVTAYTVLTGLYVAQGDYDKAGLTVEAGIGKNPKSLPLLLLKAIVYEHTSNLEKITEAYNRIFSLKPNDSHFRNDLAQAYARAGKKDAAEKILSDGVTAMPENWDMKKSLVAFLNENRGMDSAEQKIKDFITTYPEQSDLYFWLADLYIAHKSVDRAVVLLEQIVRRNKRDATDSNSLNAQTSLARIHFVMGDKPLAEKLALAVLEQSPNNRAALFVRAQMFFDQGEYQQAVSTLRTIVRDNPKATDALQLLGETLLMQGYLDLAIDTFSQLVEADHTNIPAKVRLAQLYALRGDTSKAMQLLALVTKLEASYPVGWESMARVAIGAKDWETSENAIKTLGSLEGQEKTAEFLRGQIASVKQEHEAAIASYKKVVDAEPAAPIAEHALFAMVDESIKVGKLEEITAYLKGVNLESAVFITLMGDCYQRLGKKEEAIVAYDKAMALGATQADPYLKRAALLVVEKKDEEALVLLDKAVVQTHRDLRLLLLKADILTKVKRYQEAVAVYNLVLTRNPRQDFAANNMAQLIAIICLMTHNCWKKRG